MREKSNVRSRQLTRFAFSSPLRPRPWWLRCSREPSFVLDSYGYATTATHYDLNAMTILHRVKSENTSLSATTCVWKNLLLKIDSAPLGRRCEGATRWVTVPAARFQTHAFSYKMLSEFRLVSSRTRNWYLAMWNDCHARVQITKGKRKY